MFIPMRIINHTMLKFTTLILFLFFCLYSTSQDKESNTIYKFTTEQGLSSNFIYSILQDDKGFVWIATEEGLNKFDGRNFTHYAVNKGRNSLTHNRTQTLYLAPDGNIWSGTSDGLNIYDYNSDSIIQVRTNTSPMKLVYNDITYIANSKDRNITWIGTYGNGVHYFDWNKQEFIRFSLPSNKNIKAPTNVMSLLEDDNKRLWIGTRHNGLYRYDIQNLKLEYFNISGIGSFIRCIFQDSFRRIWVGTSNGCFIYNETTNRLEAVNFPAGLINNSIGSISEDRHGRIWIGTEQNVLNFSVRSFSLLQHFAYQEISYGLSSNKLNCPSVNALFADKDNNMWIGTAWGGVNMLRGTPTKFRLYKSEGERANTLPNSPIVALSSDKNDIYVATMGTDKIGFGIFNVENESFNTLPAVNKLKGYIYQAIFKDNEGNIWLGTYNKGLIKTDKAGNKISFFYNNVNDINSIPDNDIRCITQASDKTLWFGTSNGIAKYDYKNKKMSRVSIFKNRIGIRCIKQDNEGTLWIGTYGEGLVSYKPNSGKLNMQPIDNAFGVATDLLIHNDSIWIATRSNGMKLFNKRTGSETIYNETNGLASNYVKSLVRDNTGSIWFATSKGISKLKPNTGEIENYSTQDGVQSSDFNERAVVATTNGKIAFGGFGGLNVFNPLNVNKNDKCPSVVFTKLQIFNDIVYPTSSKGKKGPLSANIALSKDIVLKHNQSVFTIEFAGINYYATQKIQYAYFLEGSDKKWNEIGNQNSVTFRNLNSGTYTFKVKASSPDAVWTDDNIASIRIIIRPPFWRTYIAYLLYIIIVFIVVYFVWQYVTIRIRANNSIKIERAKREKDEELHQEKIQFFTNISHEFRTPLTLIISPLEKMHQDENAEDKKQHLQLMLRNAKRLLDMVNQLLDFRKAERGQMKLKIQQTDMVSVLNEIFLSFEELRKEKEIQFEFIHEKNRIDAWFDVEFLNKSLFNLLSNAYKFTPQKGKIQVLLNENEDEAGNRIVEIKVTDNGKGINQEDLAFVFDRFYQGKEQAGSQKGSGIGLHLTRSLIELHHGKISVESRPFEETSFVITLPVEPSAYHKEEFMVDFETANFAPEKNVSEIAEIKQNKLDNHQAVKKILVVEDNADIRIYIRDILGKEYKVEEAENGLIGLEMAQQHDYDLIISDLMMPVMDGMEMCKQLKNSIETNHIPVILLTAKSQIESRIEGLSIGAESYITKPFHPQHLIVRVEKLIQLREMLKGRYSKKISLGDISSNNSDTDSPDEIFMQKTIKTILDKMIESDFNGDVLAYELGISRMGLHRKIKALTGQSTGEFIRNIRLKKAAELLRLPGRNISEVCYDVGFNSPSYFTTCFVEVYKMTPSEYVKSGR